MNPHPIVLVEDNTDDAFFMQRAFQAAGVTNVVSHLGDGAAAIDFLARREAQDEAKRPCLMLLDLKMPYKNGFDVLAWVRQHADFRTLAVVVLTSSNEPSDIARALELGANAYVVKPSGYSELANVVTALRDFWLRYHRSDAA